MNKVFFQYFLDIKSWPLGTGHSLCSHFFSKVRLYPCLHYLAMVLPIKNVIRFIINFIQLNDISLHSYVTRLLQLFSFTSCVSKSFIPLIQHQFFYCKLLLYCCGTSTSQVVVISHITEIAVSDFLVPDNFEDFFPVQLTC